jgi:NADH dehydrogenase
VANRPHVVVVGAGFAGIQCARRLVHEPVEVTLVDRNNYSTFTPLLYQVATAGLTGSDVAYPVRGMFHDASNVRIRTAEVTGVDWDRRVVTLDDGELPFDHLVLAAGATTNWFGIPGAAEHSLPLATLPDADRIRSHVLARFEAADADPSLVEDGALTVLIAGGGPTGVEMAGALTELFTMVLAKDFRRLDLSKARVVLVEMLPHVLGPFSEGGRRHAAEALRERGVELRLGETLEAVEDGAVRLGSGEVLRAGTIVWAVGVRANPLADALGLEQTRAGRIVVGPDQRVPGRPNVWVAGDMAATERGDSLLPQQAQPAKQTGRFIGEQIARLTRGKPVGRFRYRDLGSMATIGRRSAIADLPFRIRLRGTLGWIAWLFLHLFQLAGLRNRANVLVNWVWSYLTYDRGPRLIRRS